MKKLIDLDDAVVRILTKEAIDANTNFKNWCEAFLLNAAFHSKYNEGEVESHSFKGMSKHFIDIGKFESEQ